MTHSNTVSLTAEELIQLYGLRPHPEGGYFRESYRATGAIPQQALPSCFAGQRYYATAIYFLLPAGSRSRLHRLHADELWHFYLGGPLTLVQISPSGAVEMMTLGPRVNAGQQVQYAVPAEYWFGAFPQPGTAYSFVGCTVAPGFDYADFELGQRAALELMFPHAKEIIERLTDP